MLGTWSYGSFRYRDKRIAAYEVYVGELKQQSFERTAYCTQKYYRLFSIKSKSHLIASATS